MITLNELKKEKLLALKNKDQIKSDLYGVLIANIQKEEIEKKAKGQELKEEDISKILLKLNKELEEDKKMYQDNNRLEDVKNIEIQLDILKPLLPKMMSEEEIRKTMDKSKPMKEVIAEYKGKADIQLVLKIYKE